MRTHQTNDLFKHLTVTALDENESIVIVTLDRPRKRNAISSEMWREIGTVFSLLGSKGDDCRCIILTGAGKGFTAGLDISDTSILGSSDEDNPDVARKGISFLPKIREMQRCFTAVEDCPIPVIAAIHGVCVGAGIDLATCCDIRLAERGTSFSVREVKLGLAADVGTLQRLPKVTGNDSRVRELCYTGEDFNEDEALRIGLISRVSSSAISDAIALARIIANNSPVAVLGTKKSLVYSRDHTVADGLDHVAQHNALALMTSDIPDSFMAISMKQKPVYSPLTAHSKL